MNRVVLKPPTLGVPLPPGPPLAILANLGHPFLKALEVARPKFLVLGIDVLRELFSHLIQASGGVFKHRLRISDPLGHQLRREGLFLQPHVDHGVGLFDDHAGVFPE